MKTLLALISMFAVAATMVGCSTDENPISPQKMQEIRKQEGDQRANFRPSENSTKAPQ